MSRMLSRQRQRRDIGRCIAALILLLVTDIAVGESQFGMHVVSSRADTVSGGDVLVQLDTAVGISNWAVRLNNRDVTAEFQSVAGSGKRLAHLKNLDAKKNLLELWVSRRIVARIEMRNHPIAGPMFSGPHDRPFICQTVENGLGPAMDGDCATQTVVRYYYKLKDVSRQSELESAAAIMSAVFGGKAGALTPGFEEYEPDDPPPASAVAQTLTSEGKAVPYIVRREFGVINRAVYDIQFLQQPDQPLPTPWQRAAPGWNGRLVYSFRGGGCFGSYLQGTLGTVGTDQEPLLAQGYALATSTLNIWENCNDRLSAETLSMVKEHFIKNFGIPVHTIGIGGSGGAIQLHLIAQNYPGLIDGIVAFSSFPDIASTVQSAGDCSLLEHAFDVPGLRWTDEQKSAVSGFATWRTCTQGWGNWQILAAPNCASRIPKGLVYDRQRNPNGLRCDLYDNEINIFGRNSRTGYAHRPLDNVGVQYGLRAFNEGKIDAEHFIALNERIGGYDDDGNFSPNRVRAASESLHIAYERGLVLTGAGLNELPIIDWRPYSDDLADNHDLFRSLVTRARLISANGNADNQVIIVDTRADNLSMLLDPQGSLVSRRMRNLVQQMDQWLDNAAADPQPGDAAAKLSRNKPAGLADGCWQTDGERIEEPAAFDGRGTCNRSYPPHSDPRIVAGAPLTDDVLKCVLRPITAADYAQPLTVGQIERLKAVFPTGTCDYSRPGVGQQQPQAIWQRYETRTTAVGRQTDSN